MLTSVTKQLMGIKTDVMPTDNEKETIILHLTDRINEFQEAAWALDEDLAWGMMFMKKYSQLKDASEVVNEVFQWIEKYPDMLNKLKEAERMIRDAK